MPTPRVNPVLARLGGSHWLDEVDGRKSTSNASAGKFERTTQQQILSDRQAEAAASSGRSRRGVRTAAPTRGYSAPRQTSTPAPGHPALSALAGATASGKITGDARDAIKKAAPKPVQGSGKGGFKLGIGQAFKEIGQGLTGIGQMASSLAPGGQPAGQVWSRAGKGLVSSVAGTVKNAVPNVSPGGMGTPGGGSGKGRSIKDSYSDAVAEALGGDQYRPKDFAEKAHERGIIPAAIEDVGNVSLAAGAAKGALGAGAKLAERGGALGTAERLAGAAEHLDPIAHPYATAARSVGDVMRAAAEKVRPGLVEDLATRVPRAAEIVKTAAGIAPTAEEAAGALTTTEATRAGKTLAEATTPGLKDAHMAAVDNAVHDARVASPAPEAATLATQLASRPPAPWATWITSKLPDPVNRILAAGAPFVNKRRLAKVTQDLGRNVRMAQKVAQASPAVVAAKTAAEDILRTVPELDRFEVSRIIGEEIGARLDGTDWFETVIRDGGNAEAANALRLQARRGFEGLTPEMTARLGPEAAQRVNEAIDQAVVAWRDQRKSSLNELLSSRAGASGLEDAVLQTDAPLLSGPDLKRLNKARRDLKRAADLRDRAPDERLALAAKAEKLSGVIETRKTAVGDLRKRLDEISVRTSELHQPVPPGVLKIDRTIEAIKADLAVNGGTTFDVATGKPALGDTGYAVGGMTGTARDLIDMPYEEFAANSDEILRGIVRDNLEAWYHPDARLGLWTYTDDNGLGRIAGDISTTVDDRELAILMGEARGQQALYDITAKGDLTLSGNADMQALAKIYHNDVLANPGKSPLLRTWHEAVDAAKAVGLPASTADGVMQIWMNWDYGMHATKGTPLGEFFKSAEVQAGVRAPSAQYLAQTVLNLSTEEATGRALAELNPQQVSESLSWYYDSHDYVEGLYRGKPMTMLNGTVRDSADVFYDLLAVTSVMANPKQNLGRAMMAVANMSDWRKGQANAMRAAKALMKRIEETPPGRGPTPTGFASTAEVARRFSEIPELRDLTKSTSMIAAPKQNVIDILTGKLDLSKADTADIAALPEAWTGVNKGLAATNMPRSLVADGLVEGTPAHAAYQGFQRAHEEMLDMKARVSAFKKGGATEKQARELARVPRRIDFAREARTLAAQEDTLLANFPEIAQAHDRALMEYHGSKALAKLRSFRDNLANPADSTAVTLDSVMAQLYGLDATDWAGGGTYGQYARGIREQAADLTQKLGRDVRPHEVQALLWVYAKQEVGRQDWGRFLAHHDVAMDEIGRAIEGAQRPGPGWDPLKDYWDEELSHSLYAQDVRTQRKQVAAQVRDYAKHGETPPNDLQGEYARLMATDVSSPVESAVMTAKDRESLAMLPDDWQTAETRYEVADDAKILGQKLDSLNVWEGDVLPKIRAAVRAGDGAEATRLLNDYAAAWKPKLLGPSGGSMAVEGARSMTEAGTSQALAAERLATNKARAVPAPNDWLTRYTSSMAGRYNRAHGLPRPEFTDTTVRVLPQRTAEIAAQYEKLPDLESMTPEQRAMAERSYAVLADNVRQQYEWMTQAPDGPRLQVEYVPPGQEYGGVGVPGNTLSADEVAHAAMREDVQKNNHLNIRGTALAGDEPNPLMSAVDPDGVMVNDKFRAVHDFFGHAQAGNTFSRHGENIAFILHSQMFPEEALGAMTTELRGQTAYLVTHGEFAPQKIATDWPGEMVQPDYMSRRGSVGELHQSFGDKLVGAMVMPSNPDARLIVRLFQDANFGTLVHEGGHLLRQILPESDVQALARAYPGLLDKGLTAAKRRAEEGFVGGLMGYVTSRGTLAAGRAGLDAPFRKIAASLEQTYGAYLSSAVGDVPEHVRAFWDDMFAPPTEAGQALDNPLSGQLPHPVETKRYRWETDFESMQRARMYGEARKSSDAVDLRIAHNQAMIRTLEKGHKRVLDAMDGLADSEVQASRLERGAAKAMDTVRRHDAVRKPADAAWSPMYDAWQGLMDEAKADPTGSIATMLEGVPDTFSEVIRQAEARGFRPTHLKDVSWDKAQAQLFGHLGLGRQGVDTAIEAGTRKARSGRLVQIGAADRSIEALASAAVEVAHEKMTNALVDHIESVYTKPIKPGQAIPDGWVAWDPERDWVLTGKEVTTKSVQDQAVQGAQYIVPKEVKTALRSMSKEYDHWTFRMIRRFTSPWRTFVLTLSPKWYVNNLFGNVILATLEGVRPQDWLSAWRKVRAGNMPAEIVGQSINSFEEGASTVVGRGLKDIALHESNRALRDTLKAKTARLNEVVDEFSRTAVMDRAMRTGATREAALHRAYEAMVDYGNLGPLERGFVRSVLPFYAWQKGMVKLIARMPADHPLATRLLQQLGVQHTEYLQDQFGGILPSAYEGLVIGNHGQGINTRPWNPLLDAGSLATVNGIADAMNPFVGSFVRAGLGAPEGGFADSYGYSPTGYAVPKSDPVKDLQETIRGVPLIRMGEQTLRGKDVYEQSPSAATSIGRYLGAPRIYSPEEMDKIRERIAKAKAKVSPPPKKPEKSQAEKDKAAAEKAAKAKATHDAKVEKARVAREKAAAPSTTTATPTPVSPRKGAPCRDASGRFVKCP